MFVVLFSDRIGFVVNDVYEKALTAYAKACEISDIIGEYVTLAYSDGTVLEMHEPGEELIL